jgi:hypothetical protein
MSSAVLVPFTSDEPWRVRARDHVIACYQTAGFEVVEGNCAGPWRKAVAVTDAARRTDADVLVVADADCLSAGVAAGVGTVEAGAPWAVPHLTVHRLDQAATEAVYAGTDPSETRGRTQRPYKGFAGGGIVILSRTAWEQVPLDPRFEGWGGEDSSWALALTCLIGEPARLTADLHHLWHPPSDRMSRRWGSPESRVLEIRYIRAARAGRTARPAMTAIVDEARTALEGVAA